jgi:hypothetical protein
MYINRHMRNLRTAEWAWYEDKENNPSAEWQHVCCHRAERISIYNALQRTVLAAQKHLGILQVFP